MKGNKRIIALGLAGVLTLGLTACGGEKSAKQVLEQAVKNEQEITSMNAAIKMDMEMVMGVAGQEERVATTSTMDISMFADPLKMRMDVTAEAEGESQTMSMYAQQTGDVYTVYMNDGSDWFSQEVELGDLEQYNATSNMQLYLDGSTQLEEAGSETVNGVETYKYTGVITGDTMQEIMESSGAMDSLGGLTEMGMDESQLEELMGALGEMSISIWIDKKTCYPVRYEMDMSELMDTLMSKLMEMLQEALGQELGDMYMKIPTMTLVMECSDINAVKDFEIPAEALAS